MIFGSVGVSFGEHFTLLGDGSKLYGIQPGTGKLLWRTEWPECHDSPCYVVPCRNHVCIVTPKAYKMNVKVYDAYGGKLVRVSKTSVRVPNTVAELLRRAAAEHCPDGFKCKVYSRQLGNFEVGSGSKVRHFALQFWPDSDDVCTPALLDLGNGRLGFQLSFRLVSLNDMLRNPNSVPWKTLVAVYRYSKLLSGGPPEETVLFDSPPLCLDGLELLRIGRSLLDIDEYSEDDASVHQVSLIGAREADSGSVPLYLVQFAVTDQLNPEVAAVLTYRQFRGNPELQLVSWRRLSAPITACCGELLTLVPLRQPGYSAVARVEISSDRLVFEQTAALAWTEPCEWRYSNGADIDRAYIIGKLSGNTYLVTCGGGAVMRAPPHDPLSRCS